MTATTANVNELALLGCGDGTGTVESPFGCAGTTLGAAGEDGDDDGDDGEEEVGEGDETGAGFTAAAAFPPGTHPNQAPI